MADMDRGEARRREDANRRRGVQWNNNTMGPSGSRNPPGAQGGSPARSAIRKTPATIPQHNEEDIEMEDNSNGEQAGSANEKEYQLGAPLDLPGKTIAKDVKKAVRVFQDRVPAYKEAGYENNGKDEWLLTGIEELKAKLIRFAQQVPTVSAAPGYLDRILKNDGEELIRYVGCLCLGGDRLAWNSLLTDSKAREAIVLGVVARVLKEHVFGDYLFGADEALKAKLQEIDTSSRQHDGFERTQKRAAAVEDHSVDKAKLQHSILQTTQKIIKLLAPLWAGKDDTKKTVHAMSDAHTVLLKGIVSDAATLAHLIRKTPDVAYYWPPTFKDEEFDAPRMEVLNLEEMIETSPYDKVPNGNGTRAVLRDPNADKVQAIVRIVAFPGVVAYRQYGGNLAHNEIIEESTASSRLPPDVRDRYGGPRTAMQGFRSRLISKSVVYLQWGTQRLLTKEAGTSAHLDAVRQGKMDKYEDDSAQILELHGLWQKARAPVGRAGGQK